MFHAHICQVGCTLVLIDARHELDRGSAEAASLLEQGIDGLTPMGDLHRLDLLAGIAQQALPTAQTPTFSGERACVGFRQSFGGDRGDSRGPLARARMPGRPAICTTEPDARLIIRDGMVPPRRRR